MAQEAETKDWTALVNSVKTPLGFFALLALILASILTGAAALTDKISVWAPLGLLGALFAAVTLIALFKPLVLYHPSDWPVTHKPVTVCVLFPADSADVDLDIEKCLLEVRDKLGQSKQKNIPNLVFGHGGWVFQVAETVEPTDSVRLELMEVNGRRWRVKPFPPYEARVQAAKLG